MKIDVPKFLKSPLLSPRKELKRKESEASLSARLWKSAGHLDLDMLDKDDDGSPNTSIAHDASSSSHSSHCQISSRSPSGIDHKVTLSPRTLRSKRRASLTSTPTPTTNQGLPPLNASRSRPGLLRRASMGHVPSYYKPASLSKQTLSSSSLSSRKTQRRRSSMSAATTKTSQSSYGRHRVENHHRHHQHACPSSPSRQLQRRASLDQLYAGPSSLLGYHADKKAPRLVMPSHRDVILLQSYWRDLGIEQRSVLGETILWHVLEHDPTARARLGIRSFRGAQVTALITLLVDTMEAVISLAGPDLMQEDFSSWIGAWSITGLRGAAVAAVLEDSLGEFDRDRPVDSSKATPEITHAWKSILVPVLSSL